MYEQFPQILKLNLLLISDTFLPEVQQHVVYSFLLHEAKSVSPSERILEKCL